MRLPLLLGLLLLIACRTEQPASPAGSPAGDTLTAAPAPAPPSAADPAAANPAADPNGPWAQARAQGVAFRAIGQEPGWVLHVYGDPAELIEMEADYGEVQYLFRFPEQETSPRGDRVYRALSGGRLFVAVAEDSPCTDIMSGEHFPRTVSVTFDGRTFTGCGRPLD